MRGRISSGDGNQIDVPIASGEQYYVGFTLSDLAAVGASLSPAGTVIQTPPYTILAGVRIFGFVGGSDSLAYDYNESSVIMDFSENYGVFVSSAFTLDFDDFDASLNTTDFGIEVGLGNNYEVGGGSLGGRIAAQISYQNGIRGYGSLNAG